MLSLMFLLGVWSIVKVSMVQSPSPHELNGQGIASYLSCVTIWKAEQEATSMRASAKYLDIGAKVLMSNV